MEQIGDNMLIALQVSELEAQLLHLMQARNCSPDSTPKGSVSEHATISQTGLAPPVSDSFKVRILPKLN